MSVVYLSASPEETAALGRRLAPHLPPGPTLLTGELGAGKTTFVKGVAEGLGAAPQDEVTSPTFALVHEYGSPVRLYHLDLYRLENVAETFSLGIEELIDARVPVLIEWGERFVELWPPGTPRIRISDEGSSERRIVVEELSPLVSL
jgi:tRNA threonylcarbamoyladenosine biosynthesis protein TsaE